VCRHVRNVPDDVLERVRDNGGVVMVTFLGFYVSEDLRMWGVHRAVERDRLTTLHGQETDTIRDELAVWVSENPRPDATIGQVADHIDHIRALIGIDHIGLGGDYDGTSSLPVGMQDVSNYPELLIELLRRGYSDQAVKKIIGLNMLRVMRRVEDVAAQLQAATEPSDARLP